MLTCLATHVGVLEHLMNGADLMWPGVSGELPEFKSGDVLGVSVKS
jgi:predicted ribosome-associated RNA-binding protein Tma20